MVSYIEFTCLCSTHVMRYFHLNGQCKTFRIINLVRSRRCHRYINSAIQPRGDMWTGGGDQVEYPHPYRQDDTDRTLSAIDA